MSDGWKQNHQSFNDSVSQVSSKFDWSFGIRQPSRRTRLLSIPRFVPEGVKGMDRFCSSLFLPTLTCLFLNPFKLSHFFLVCSVTSFYCRQTARTEQSNTCSLRMLADYAFICLTCLVYTLSSVFLSAFLLAFACDERTVRVKISYIRNHTYNSAYQRQCDSNLSKATLTLQRAISQLIPCNERTILFV